MPTIFPRTGKIPAFCMQGVSQKIKTDDLVPQIGKLD